MVQPEGATLTAYSLEELWSERAEEMKKTFLPLVQEDLYLKMLLGTLVDPRLALDGYRLEMGEVTEHENSIDTSCGMIYEDHTIRFDLTFVKGDNGYYISGYNYYEVA